MADEKFYERWDLIGEAALTGTAGYISATSGMRAVSAQARVGVAESVQAQEQHNNYEILYLI